ncbi:putative bifunctional diguanylate cyclase/phosphodiesterase [Colwelliaceae bacterium BS250]
MPKNTRNPIPLLSKLLFTKDAPQHNAYQVFIISQFGLLLAAFLQISTGAYYLAGILSVTFVLIGTCYLSLKDRYPTAATNVFLFSHTCLTIGLMWSYGGIHDEIVLAFPMILIFAAVVGSAVSVAVLYSIIMLMVFANGYANHIGYLNNEAQIITLQSAALVNLILLVIFVCTFITAQKIKVLINRLKLENRKVEQSKREIEKLVHQDTLTGLSNRVVAEATFEESISKAKQNNNLLALLFLDLDDFKSINDTLGHQVGDKFLKMTSIRIAGKVAPFGSLYRLGGDEFIILLESVSSIEEIKEISLKIAEVVSQPLTINDYKLSACCSIGVSIAPNDADDFDTALKYADIALYKAKNSGRNQICFISAEMITKTAEDFNLLKDLRKAIESESLQVHYQPKIDLINNKIIGAESLLRWFHPQLGNIPPNQFIPLAEKSGLIHKLGFWGLEQAIKECVSWHKRGHVKLVVAVNFSPIQFNTPGFAKQILDKLGLHGLSERYLEIEITENVLVDNSDITKDNLHVLATAGVNLAIDNFGTGYSNLSKIKKLKVSAIKIDRVLIEGITQSEDDLAIVTAIIDIANRLDIKPVAEGVESAEVAQVLKKLNCNTAQGFLWSPAVAAHLFKDQLSKQKGPLTTSKIVAI